VLSGGVTEQLTCVVFAVCTTPNPPPEVGDVVWVSDDYTMGSAVLLLLGARCAVRAGPSVVCKNREQKRFAD